MKKKKIILKKNKLKVRIKILILSCFWFNKYKNNFIYCGKKQKIENVFNNLFTELKLKYRCLPIIFFYEIIEKLKSPIILFPFRRGIKVYLLPIYTKPVKQYINAIFWLVKDIKKNINKNTKISTIIKLKFEELINQNITDELLLNNQKIITYKIAAENRIFLHYRWKN
jgi:ribosomal protein S7